MAEAEVGSRDDFPALGGDVDHFGLVVGQVEDQ